MARKKNQADEVLAPDPFLELSKNAGVWFEKNAKLVLIGAGVIFAGVIAWEFMAEESARESSKVTTELGKSVERYSEATDLRAVLTSTSPAAVERNYESARTGFESFRSTHSAHPSSKLAALYEADLLSRLKKYGDAAERYKIFLDGASMTHPLRFMGLEGLGYAQEGEGKLDEALESFRKLADGQPFMKDYALKHQGRILEKKGDVEGAKAAYKAIAEMDPESGLKSFAEDRLKSLH